MIDKFNLTIDQSPDIEYLRENGEVVEDARRSKLYRYMGVLDKAVVSFEPHKFSERTNAKIPYTRIDINPKHFECFDDMVAYLSNVFGGLVTARDFRVSRIDIAADVVALPIDVLLCNLHVKRIRTDSLSFFKGTVYAGTDPKLRIYDKGKEIKARLSKGKQGITDYEKSLLESGLNHTRFEYQLRTIGKNLQNVADDPEIFASYFDRLELFDFQGINGAGVLQVQFKYINRKFRADLDKFRDMSLIEELKRIYIEEVKEWFDSGKDPF